MSLFNNFRTGELVRRKEVIEMKYSDVLKEAQSLVSETIVDYRPACGLYVDGMDDCEQIPNAIVCWTKNGSEFIYIKKGDYDEKIN